MNKAFKQNKILVLDANYLIKPDNGNGVILVYTNGKAQETFHFTRIAQALRKYVDRELMVEDNIEDMIAKAERIYALIEKIDLTFKQY